MSALRYDQLPIQESLRRDARGRSRAAELPPQKVVVAGIDTFVDREALGQFLARAAFAGFAVPDVPQALRDLCLGLRSFTELKTAAANLVSVLEQKLGTRQLTEMAPARLRLAKGRETKVHYEAGRPPRIPSRLRTFSEWRKRRDSDRSERP